MSQNINPDSQSHQFSPLNLPQSSAPVNIKQNKNDQIANIAKLWNQTNQFIKKSIQKFTQSYKNNNYQEMLKYKQASKQQMINFVKLLKKSRQSYKNTQKQFPNFNKEIQFNISKVRFMKQSIQSYQKNNKEGKGQLIQSFQSWKLKKQEEKQKINFASAQFNYMRKLESPQKQNKFEFDKSVKHQCDVIQSLVLPLKFPQIFVGLMRPLKTVLLYGPPHSGKTFLSHACLGELQNCQYYVINCKDLMSKQGYKQNRGLKLLRNQLNYLLKNTQSKSLIIHFEQVHEMCPMDWKLSCQEQQQKQKQTYIKLQIKSEDIKTEAQEEHSQQNRLKKQQEQEQINASPSAEIQKQNNQFYYEQYLRLIVTQYLIFIDKLYQQKNKNIILVGQTSKPWDLDHRVRRRFSKRIYFPQVYAKQDKQKDKQIKDHQFNHVNNINYDQYLYRPQKYQEWVNKHY